MYEYRCKLRKVVDGDTVDIDIDLGFGVWLQNERVRLFGIDTPESRTRDLEEKKYGLAAKEVLKTKEYDAKGKFGRILGELWRTSTLADKSLNDYLIDTFNAVAYHGQSKEDISEKHLANRAILKL